MANEIVFKAPGNIPVKKVKFTSSFKESSLLLVFDDEYGYVKARLRQYEKLHDMHELPAQCDKDGFVYVGDVDSTTVYLTHVRAVALVPKNAPELKN